MKQITVIIKDNGERETFRHLKTACEKYKLKVNTVCRYKFPKYLKKHGITIEKEDLK